MTRLSAVLAAVLATTGPALAESGFSIDLGFDPAATSDLDARGEWVMVSVWYYGDPNEAGLDHTDEVGQVYLGTEELTLRPVSRRVTVGGNIDERALAEWVEGGVVRANVNVYSARFTDENNLLECGIFDDAVSVAQNETPRIDCKLLGGGTLP